MCSSSSDFWVGEFGLRFWTPHVINVFPLIFVVSSLTILSFMNYRLKEDNYIPRENHAEHEDCCCNFCLSGNNSSVMCQYWPSTYKSCLFWEAWKVSTLWSSIWLWKYYGVHDPKLGMSFKELRTKRYWPGLPQRCPSFSVGSKLEWLTLQWRSCYWAYREVEFQFLWTIEKILPVNRAQSFDILTNGTPIWRAS